MKSISMIILAIVLMLIPLMVINCSCSGDTTAIKNVINSYWDAYNQGDYDMALTYTNCEDEYKEIAIITAMKSVTGDVTVQSIEDIYISGSRATANVTLYIEIAEQTDTDEVKLVRVDGDWKIDISKDDIYKSAKVEIYTVQNAVSYAMLEVSVGILNPGYIDNTPANTVTYGTLGDTSTLPIGTYIIGGLESLVYVYSVDTDGKVNAINGPLAE